MRYQRRIFLISDCSSKFKLEKSTNSSFFGLVLRTTPEQIKEEKFMEKMEKGNIGK
jgi:hypothetical protein